MDGIKKSIERRRKIRKRIFLSLLIAVLAAGVCCGIFAYISSKNVLRVGYNPSFEPMSYRDESGEARGYFIDIMNEAADRMGTKLSAVPYNSLERKWYMDKERLDCFIDFDECDIYERYCWAEAPLLKTKTVVLVPAASPIERTSDFGEGDSIAFLGSQFFENQAIYEIPEEIFSYQASTGGYFDLPSLLDAVELFRHPEDWESAQGMMFDNFSAEYIMNKYPGKYRMLPDLMNPATYSVGFLKGNTELQARFNAAFAEMQADGTVAKISERWFGRDITKDF